MPGLKEKVFLDLYEREVRAGRVPRRSYAHYFIEDGGLHSRIHLQNFYSTFWPDADVAATAHVRAFDATGREIATTDVELPRFGSMFLEIGDLLARGDTDGVREGSVAVDLEPPEELRERFAELPSPDSVHINTPFWMAYYDGDENYMYVHSIEVLGGEVAGASAALRWHLGRAPSTREAWRSWRLLDVEALDELQLVVMNHDTRAGETAVAVHAAGGETLWQQRVTLAPRALQRVRVAPEEIARWRAEQLAEHVRIGLDPLLTANGKPYVIMRYGGGPLSLHHG
jgi:hypothetical protein